MTLRDRIEKVKGWLATAATVIAAGGVGVYSADFRTATEKLCDSSPPYCFLLKPFNADLETGAYRIGGERGRPEVCWLEAEGWAYKSGWVSGMKPGDDCTDAIENAKLMQLEGTGPYPRGTLGEKPEDLFWMSKADRKAAALRWLERDRSDTARIETMAGALEEVTREAH